MRYAIEIQAAKEFQCMNGVAEIVGWLVGRLANLDDNKLESIDVRCLE
jgi:hypothetical protein